MQIKKEKSESRLIVYPEERLDTETSIDFGVQVKDDLDGITELVIDFKKVVYVSSIGLRVILELRKQMNQQGTMKLKNVCKDVFAIFEMTGFTNILDIEEL